VCREERLWKLTLNPTPENLKEALSWTKLLVEANRAEVNSVISKAVNPHLEGLARFEPVIDYLAKAFPLQALCSLLGCLLCSSRFKFLR